MKVVDLQLFRSKKAVEALEKKMGELALHPELGAVREMKTCFREWLQKQQALKN